MAELHFEVWEIAETNSQEMSPVNRDADRLRQTLMPNAVRVHSFTASSTFDAFRKLNAWNGFGEWIPPPECEDEVFSDQEAQEQRLYLRDRTGD